MPAYISTLKKGKNKIYPRTMDSAVYTSNGDKLSKVVGDLSSEVEKLKSEGGGNADNIKEGQLGGKIQANAEASAELESPQVRDIQASTEDLVEGTSTLASGSIYIVYE